MLKTITTIVTTTLVASTTMVAPVQAGFGAFGINSPLLNEVYGIQTNPMDQKALQVCRQNGYSQMRTVGHGRYQCFTGINTSGVWSF